MDADVAPNSRCRSSSRAAASAAGGDDKIEAVVSMRCTATLCLLSLVLNVPTALSQVREPGADRRIVGAAERGDWAMVQTLLKRRAPVNSRGADGSTALLWSAYRSNLPMVKALVAAGADVGSSWRGRVGGPLVDGATAVRLAGLAYRLASTSRGARRDRLARVA